MKTPDCNNEYYVVVAKVLILLAITFFAFRVYWNSSSISCTIHKLEEVYKKKLDSMPNRIPANISGLDQNDMALVRKVQFHLLVPPSEKPYNFTTTMDKLRYQGQIGVPPVIDEYLKNKTNGFFVEAGAHDGEAISNTLLFEVKRNWTGLLVEPGPSYDTLLTKNRKAFQIQCALAGGPKATYVSIAGQGVLGYIGNKTTHKKGQKLVPSIPLYTILKALGNPVVDYFSLDTNYREVDVLKSIPWDLVDIRAISVEVLDITSKNNTGEIVNYMKSVGYKIWKYVEFDVIFIK